MNLKDVNPKIDHELFCMQLEKEFANLYPNAKVNREVLDYKVLSKNE